MEKGVSEAGVVSFSGAKLIIDGDRVVKICDNAEMQHDFMRLVPGVFPRVKKPSEHHNSYVMERLAQIDYTVENRAEVFAEYLHKLRELWRTSAYGDHAVAWRTRLKAWMVLVSAPEAMLAELPNIALAARAPCTIHGDATLENAMRHRVSGELVLVDPLSSGGKIPACPLVDRGKLLQSALGWEAIRTGNTWIATERLWTNEYKAITGDLQDWEIRAVRFWCAVHLWRIKPYTAVPEIHQWIEQRVGELLR